MTFSSLFRLSVLGLVAAGAGAQTQTCPSRDVTANFLSGNGNDYSMTVTNDRVSDFDGYSGLDLEINLCEGDDLIITREPDWAGHDLYIDGGIDGAIDFNQNTGTIEDPMAGTYNYYCTVAGHEEMLGTIKVLPSSDPTCQCEEGARARVNRPVARCDGLVAPCTADGVGPTREGAKPSEGEEGRVTVLNVTFWGERHVSCISRALFNDAVAAEGSCCGIATCASGPILS